MKICKIKKIFFLLLFFSQSGGIVFAESTTDDLSFDEADVNQIQDQTVRGKKIKKKMLPNMET